MQQKGYWYTFGLRVIVCYILCIVLFFVSVLRLTTLSTANYTEVQTAKNGIRLTIGRQRGTIYDCNNTPLTNDKELIMASVLPTPNAIITLRSVLKGEELASALDRLKDGKPILCQLPREVDCEDIVCFRVYESTQPSRHLIGYTDKDGKGVSGLQKAYDHLLYCEEELSLYYETDAKGRALEGVAPEITQGNTLNGVITTIDSGIQAIAEEYSKYIEKGAIVVAEAESGKIRGAVSRPSFDSESIEIYLESEASPLFNRITNAYNVGSVFKPCVAIAGLENGITDFTYTCTGSCEIVDRFFKCHKLDGHGQLGLCEGLAFSCNTFFYNLAFKIGQDSIYKTAKSLSFGESITLCENMQTAKGNMPTQDSILNIAHLANFSIGQGELLLSPISILPLYCAIACDGSYYLPSLVEKTVENGEKITVNNGAPTRVMKSSTAEILRGYLKSVLDEGTGEKAKPKTVSAAGKTATAQTGKYDGGKEICSGWFCGFFPAENPEYVVVVFSEDDRKQALTCSEIFALIADKIKSSQIN